MGKPVKFYYIAKQCYYSLNDETNKPLCNSSIINAQVQAKTNKETCSIPQVGFISGKDPKVVLTLVCQGKDDGKGNYQYIPPPL